MTADRDRRAAERDAIASTTAHRAAKKAQDEFRSRMHEKAAVAAREEEAAQSIARLECQLVRNHLATVYVPFRSVLFCSVLFCSVFFLSPTSSF